MAEAQVKSAQQQLALAKVGARPEVVAAAAADVACLLYTSDAADERSSVDLGGRRIIKKKNLTSE